MDNIRLKAMNSMMKDKPSLKMKPRQEMEEMEDGMVSMAVTPEEKEMILAARETNGQSEVAEEEIGEEAY